MKPSDLKFIIVEDSNDYQTEVLNQLGKAELNPANRLGIAATYDDAKELLEQQAGELDVVFLDLNIPRSENDPRPEDRHGVALLNLIHGDLNKRPMVDISVIIVSGQELATNEAGKNLLLGNYTPTLVGIVPKEALTVALKANLRRLRRDAIASALRRLGINLVTQWETLIDPLKSTLDRLSAARTIAIRIAQNEIDHHEGRDRSHPEYEDKLGWICGHLRDRFDRDPLSGKVRVSSTSIHSRGGWGGFVWRGLLMEHLQTIDSYWQTFKHLPERPYDNPTGDPDEWHTPRALIERGNKGETAASIAELAVRDLLEWYLPWHEQVLGAVNP